jgi:hypothetical protein
MTTMDLTQRTGGSSSSQDRPVLPTDSYRMRIMDAKLEDDTFAKPNNDGSLPQKFVLTFEMTTLTEEQQEAASDTDQDWSEVRIWHRFNPFYGLVREGGPSKFKEFLDNLIAWQLVMVDLRAFDITSLVGIELKCSVVQYTKTMGANKGQPGNKITGFAPIKAKRKNAPQAADVAATMPAASAEPIFDEAPDF